MERYEFSRGMDYAEIVAASERVAWTVDEIFRDRRFDASRPIVPASWVGTRDLGFLSDDEQRVLNRCRAFSYAHLLGNFEEFAPPQAFCTGVTRSSAASSGEGRGRAFSQVPKRSIARFALSQSRSKTHPLSTSDSVTAAVAAASSRIRLPDDQRSGRASSRWRRVRVHSPRDQARSKPSNSREGFSTPMALSTPNGC